MNYPKIRTALLTLILGLVSVPFFTPLLDKWKEPYVELPQIESTSPLFVKRCSDEETPKFYRKYGYIVVNKTKGINCNDDGGGGGSGNGGRNHEPASVRYIDDVSAKAKLKSGYRKTKKH